MKIKNPKLLLFILYIALVFLFLARSYNINIDTKWFIGIIISIVTITILNGKRLGDDNLDDDKSTNQIKLNSKERVFTIISVMVLASIITLIYN